MLASALMCSRDVNIMISHVLELQHLRFEL